MKVYVILEQNEYTDYEFCGVYGTIEEVKVRIANLVNEFSIKEENLYWEEYEV